VIVIGSRKFPLNRRSIQSENVNVEVDCGLELVEYETKNFRLIYKARIVDE
jgi:hypothetical protein